MTKHSKSLDELKRDLGEPDIVIPEDCSLNERTEIMMEYCSRHGVKEITLIRIGDNNIIKSYYWILNDGLQINAIEYDSGNIKTGINWS